MERNPKNHKIKGIKFRVLTQGDKIHIQSK